jgi:hypothetical protein
MFLLRTAAIFMELQYYIDTDSTLHKSNTLKTETELVPETLEHFHIVTRLLARENFIEFRRRENIKTYYIT